MLLHCPILAAAVSEALGHDALTELSIPTIYTERLTLRAFREVDVQPFAFWGRGYPTEGITRRHGLGFENRDFDELIILIDPANTASIGVARKLGESLRRKTTPWEHRVLVYGISREE